MRLPIENDEWRVIGYLEGTHDEIEAELDRMLDESKRFKSVSRRETIERCVLRALSLLNREPGAEHQKSTARRRAGGGRLVKGS